MRYILAILLLCAGSANASIYHYKYHGQPMNLVASPDYDFWVGEPFQPPAVADVGDGSPIELEIWIDSSQMPGGKLGNIDIDHEHGPDPAPAWFTVQGNYFFPRWGQATFSYASIKFDSLDYITDWIIGVGVDYPQMGPMISNTKDRYEIFDGDLFLWESDTGGYWERISPVASVPLPAGGLLLLGGLGLLGVRRLWR